MFASTDLNCLRHILSEVETFSWVDLTAHSHLKIFVGYLSIPIQVKLIEEVLELFIIKVKTPVLEVESEFIWHDGSWLLHV